MPRTLKAIAAEINATPALGLRAECQSSRSSTDSPIPGTRLRNVGKGRKGLQILVWLVRNGKLVCDVDTSQTYRSAREVEEWLAKWKVFDRTYKGAPAPHYRQYRVEGELQASRGRVLTAAQFEGLATDAPIWVRIKTHGEDDFHQVDEVNYFGHQGARSFSSALDFNRHDPRIPQGDEKLLWDEPDCSVGLYKVKLTPYKHEEPPL